MLILIVRYWWLENLNDEKTDKCHYHRHCLQHYHSCLKNHQQMHCFSQANKDECWLHIVYNWSFINDVNVFDWKKTLLSTHSAIRSQRICLNRGLIFVMCKLCSVMQISVRHKFIPMWCNLHYTTYKVL